MSKAELLRTGNGGAITVETEIDDTNKDSLNPPSTKAIMEKVGGGGGVTVTFGNNCATLSRRNIRLYFADGTDQIYTPAQMVGQVKGVSYFETDGEVSLSETIALKFGVSSVTPYVPSGTFLGSNFPVVLFKDTTVVKVLND